MAYFFLDCFPYKKPLRDLDYSGPAFPGVEVSDFNKGKQIEIATAEPAHFEVFDKGEMPEFFILPTLVMRPDFAEALADFGIDNIQTFAAKLTDPDTGATWDYVLGNIKGLVDIFDQERSQIHSGSPPKTAMLFNTIVIDESAAHGFDILRPLHKTSSILISERLKNHLESYGAFSNTYFVPPEKYV